MNRLIRLGATMLPLLLWSSPAGAAEHFSVLSGRTVGNDNTVLHVQAGWPGISATILHGISPVLDLGGLFAFNYGIEGTTNVAPGIKLAGVARFNLVDTPKYNIGFGGGLGFVAYFPSGGSTIGITIPISFAAGFSVAPQLMVTAGFDLPILIGFSHGGGVLIPILFGGGFEYTIDPTLLLTFNLRFGPAIYGGSAFAGASGAVFDMVAQLGVAYKF